MNKYPSVITENILEQNKHIPNDEIQKDIDDTLREIKTENAKAELNETIYKNSESQPERRMAAFRMDGAHDAANRRQEFVNFLQLLFLARVAAQVQE